MKNKSIIILFLLLISFIPIYNIQNINAIGENWLENWDYRKQIDICNSSYASTGYQILIKVYMADGTDGNEMIDIVNAGKVFLNNKCNNNFGDIRFTENDGFTELNYYQDTDNLIDGVSSLFWVKISDDLSLNRTIYIYYGNSEISTSSNGVNTFKLFDDFNDSSFDTSKWNTVISSGCSITESNNHLLFNISSGTGAKTCSIASKTTYTNSMLRVKLNCSLYYTSTLYRYWGFVYVPKYTMFDTVTTSGLTGINYNTGQYIAGYNTINISVTKIYDIYWKTSTFTDFHIDNSRLYNTSTQIPTTGLYAHIEHYSTSLTTYSNMFIDYIFLREYVTPEPYIYNWGIEEIFSITEYYTQEDLDINFITGLLLGFICILLFGLLIINNKKNKYY